MSQDVLTRTKGIMESKISSLIGPGGASATALLNRLSADEISDAVVSIGPGANGRGGRIALVDDQVGFEFGGRVRTFHPHAAVQFGEKLGVPGSWLRDQVNGAGWQRAMAADVMATTLQNTSERDRILVRSVGDTVRGILSDRFRRISSPAIADAFGRSLARVGAVPFQSRQDDLRWNLSAILPVPIGLNLPNHGEQYIAAGVRISNSDFGAGATDLSFFWLRLACLNGMISESVMREIHLGARLPDNIQLSERTYRLDTETVASTIEDAVGSLLTNDAIKTRLQVVQAAAAEVIEVKAIDGLVKANRISKADAVKINEVLTESDPNKVPEGALTRFKLAQAVSWLAHDEAVTIDRKAELEALAGTLMSANLN